MGPWVVGEGMRLLSIKVFWGAGQSVFGLGRVEEGDDTDAEFWYDSQIPNQPPWSRNECMVNDRVTRNKGLVHALPKSTPFVSFLMSILRVRIRIRSGYGPGTGLRGWDWDQALAPQGTVEIYVCESESESEEGQQGQAFHYPSIYMTRTSPSAYFQSASRSSLPQTSISTLAWHLTYIRRL
jgi:hypothetical protein